LPNAGSLLFEADAAGTDISALSVDSSEIVQIGASGASSVNFTPAVTMASDLTVSGTASIGTILMSNVVPSVGNLTLNAVAAGTISIGNSSTGAIVLTGGGVDIGDGATDTLTITGIINSDVTLDDGTTDSPALIFKDSDDETGRIHQDQATDDLEVTCHSALDSFAVTTGNLSVGTPNADVIVWDGNDFFVADDMEVDGTLVVDTDLDVNGTANISGATYQGGVLTLGANGLTLDGATDNVFEWNETSEDLLWTFGATSIDLSSTTGIVQFDFFDNVADAVFTHATDGAADDLHITLTGATDSTLRITSSGTGADAMVLSTTAGGIDITVAGAAADEDIDITTNTSINISATAETVADQIVIDAQGAVAGNAINIKTTDGGIIVNAVGVGNGDVTINAGDDILIAPTDDLTLTSTGLTLINPTETLALSSSDWGISTTGAATLMASVGFDSGTVIYNDTVELTAQQVKALNGTPIQLVAAPGINKFVEVVSVIIILDYSTSVFTETDDNLVVQYGTSGDDITAAIEMTGFIDQSADTIMIVYPAHPLAANAAADMVNNKVELYNPNDEIGGNVGNESAVTVKISYRVHTDGL